jgi:hypothetical protein
MGNFITNLIIFTRVISIIGLSWTDALCLGVLRRKIATRCSDMESWARFSMAQSSVVCMINEQDFEIKKRAKIINRFSSLFIFRKKRAGCYIWS